MASRGSKPKWVKELAKKRIMTLRDQAEENKLEHPERSRRYCELASKISKKYNTSLGLFKKEFCKNCFTYFTSETMKKRKVSKQDLFEITCLICGYKRKTGVKNERINKSRIK